MIENKELYYYKGILKNYDALKEFFKNYKEIGEKTEIPTEYNKYHNILIFLKSRLEMFEILYEYNTFQFYCWLILTMLHIVGVYWAWRKYDDHLEKMKKTKVQ